METIANSKENKPNVMESPEHFENEINGFELEGHIVEQAIREAEEAIEKERDPEKKEKMMERLARYARRVVGITSLATLALGINHIATHNNDIEKISNKETTEYLHSDPETNEVINFITGKEDLTYQQKERIIKTKIEHASPDMIKGYDLDNMSLDEMDEKIFTPNGGSLREEYGEKWVDSVFATPPEINTDQYNAIWKIIEKTGNPNIHWDIESKQARAHYNPLNHTMYVTPILFGDPGSFLEKEFLAELSHSQQFSKTPISSYGKVIVSGFNMLKKFVERGGKDSFEDIQMEEYRQHGSLEHEAHSEIEPDLKKKFENTRDLSSN